ncbi:MAG TPA: TIGR02391 family protein [Iamia sp.]|nr:TIGR02391 family protein [Iamia sp.]
MDVAAAQSHIQAVAARFNKLQRSRLKTPAAVRERALLSHELRRMFHITRAIADELGRPDLRHRLSMDKPLQELGVTIVELQGAFKAYQELPAILGPTGPQLSASALHPLIWDAATRLWDDGYYRQAIQVAAQALEAKLQAVLERPDVQGADLATGYSLSEPDDRWPRRLRLPGIDPASSTWKSAHEGAAALVRAAFMYVRNLASHPGAPEPTLEECLEQLAVLSMAARLLDRSEAVEAPPTDF